MSYFDQYCERAGDPGLWAEPVNAITNLAFLVAALLALGDARRHGVGPRSHADIWFLIAVVFVIGIGSAAWHLVPTGGTLLADVLPITIFIHVYLGAFLVRLLGVKWPLAIVVVVVFLVFGYWADNAVPPGTLNGTVGYLPAYGALVVLTAILFARAHPMRARLITVLLIWTASLTFRTVDSSICSSFPMGTHGFWHLLNALVLYLLLALLIRNEGRKSPA